MFYPILISVQLSIFVDAAGHARITDFGCSAVTQGPDSTQSISHGPGHAVQWAAPEIAGVDGIYSKEADVFSFAMVMIEVRYELVICVDHWFNDISLSQVFTGAAPFGDRTPQKAMEAIVNGERPPRPTHSAFTDKLWILMQRCWHQDPRMRPRALELLADIRGSWVFPF